MKNALMIPIHTKKLNWLNLCLNSLSNCNMGGGIDFDIVLLVSNLDEEIIISRAIEFIFKTSGISKISHQYSIMHNIKFLNIQQYIKINMCNDNLLKRYNENQERCIVNLKKFLGLYWAKDYYDFILCVDCDIIFLNNLEFIFKKALKNYNKNIYFAGFRPNPSLYSDILQNCASFIDNFSLLKFQKNDVIKNNTKDFTLYPWFFDIPAYKSSDLVDFFKYVGNFYEKITWHSFEHIIFIFWRIVKEDSKLIDYTTELGITNSSEGLTANDILNINLKYDYTPLWINYRRLLTTDCHLCYDIPMVFHVDRI